MGIAVPYETIGGSQMIEWIEYDRTSRDIESHKNHLITDGLNVWIAQHAKYVNGTGYGWHEDREPLHLPVSYWAKINLPLEELK
jgi:hypothetical protein